MQPRIIRQRRARNNAAGGNFAMAEENPAACDRCDTEAAMREPVLPEAYESYTLYQCVRPPHARLDERKNPPGDGATMWECRKH
jgi:hypothetical protein